MSRRTVRQREDATRLDLYDSLGVSRDASDAAIRSAYRRCALTAHPDKEGGSCTKFLAIVTAFETLSDCESRHRYDDELNRRCSSDGLSENPIVEADTLAGACTTSPMYTRFMTSCSERQHAACNQHKPSRGKTKSASTAAATFVQETSSSSRTCTRVAAHGRVAEIPPDFQSFESEHVLGSSCGLNVQWHDLLAAATSTAPSEIPYDCVGDDVSNTPSVGSWLEGLRFKLLELSFRSLEALLVSAHIARDRHLGKEQCSSPGHDPRYGVGSSLEHADEELDTAEVEFPITLMPAIGDVDVKCSDEENVPATCSATELDSAGQKPKRRRRFSDTDIKDGRVGSGIKMRGVHHAHGKSGGDYVAAMGFHCLYFITRSTKNISEALDWHILLVQIKQMVKSRVREGCDLCDAAQETVAEMLKARKDEGGSVPSLMYSCFLSIKGHKIALPLTSDISTCLRQRNELLSMRQAGVDAAAIIAAKDSMVQAAKDARHARTVSERARRVAAAASGRHTQSKKKRVQRLLIKLIKSQLQAMQQRLCVRKLPEGVDAILLTDEPKLVYAELRLSECNSTICRGPFRDGVAQAVQDYNLLRRVQTVQGDEAALAHAHELDVAVMTDQFMTWCHSKL